MAKKKNTGIYAIVLVIALAVAGFAGYTAMNKMPAKDADVTASVDSEGATAPIETETPAAVEAAAGDVKEKSADVPDPMADAEGLVVEPGNPVVARVDGKDITRVDVYRFIQTMPQNIQQMPAATVYPMAMEQVINTRIVQNKANEADVTQSEAFKLEMEMAKQQIARNLYLQQQVDKKITDAKLKKSYDAYVKKIPDVEERRAQHILVETEDRAKAVVEKLKTGEKFEELAKSLSIGPTGAKGGDLGYFTKDEMVPEFAEAAFKMEKNSVLETPVKTQFGWHVIKVTDVRQRAKPTFEQMKPMLQAEQRRVVLEELLANWRKNVNIEQFDINGKPLKPGANATGLVSPTPQAQQGG